MIDGRDWEMRVTSVSIRTVVLQVIVARPGTTLCFSYRLNRNFSYSRLLLIRTAYQSCSCAGHPGAIHDMVGAGDDTIGGVCTSQAIHTPHAQHAGVPVPTCPTEDILRSLGESRREGRAGRSRAVRGEPA